MIDTSMKFNKHSFSPPLFFDPFSSPEQIARYISFGSLNMRGLRSSPNKFLSLFSDLHDKHLSVLALQETHLSPREGKHKLANAISSLSLPSHSYTSHWCHNPADN